MANMLFKSQSIARNLRICSISPSFSLALPQTVVRRPTSTSSAATSNASSTEARPRKIPTCADLVAAAPPSIKPYLQLMRLNSPTGSWLLFWPCTWSIALATPAGHLPSLYYLFLFGAGSILMRGAGCVVNDIIDRDFDRKVERTKLRPLACGILSERQAVHFLAVLLSASLVILLQFNWFSVAVGSSSLFLVAAYPFAKRFTYWPQFVLGATLNWGVLIAWAEMLPREQFYTVLPLYFSTVLHTVIYDTIYSHQDKADDILIGVKSTALRFGENTKYWLSGFGSAAIAGLALTGHLAEQTWPYYVALAGTAVHLGWQVGTLKINDESDCWKKFKSNQWFGAILFAGIVAGTLMKDQETTAALDNDDEISDMDSK